MLKFVRGRSKMKLSTKVINGLKAVNLKAHKKNVSIIFQKKKRNRKKEKKKKLQIKNNLLNYNWRC